MLFDNQLLSYSGGLSRVQPGPGVRPVLPRQLRLLRAHHLPQPQPQSSLPASSPLQSQHLPSSLLPLLLPPTSSYSAPTATAYIAPSDHQSTHTSSYILPSLTSYTIADSEDNDGLNTLSYEDTLGAEYRVKSREKPFNVADPTNE